MNIPPEKIQRFIGLIKMLLRDVDRHRSLTITHKIDDSYYMQKCEELRLLAEALNEQEEKLKLLQLRMNTHYRDVYCQWKTDYLWMKRHLKQLKMES